MGMKTARDFVSEGKNAGLAAKLRYEHNNYREGYAAAAYAPQDGRVELLAYGKKGKRGDQTMSRDFSSGGKWTKKVPTDEDLTVGYLQGGLRLTPDQKLSLSYYDYGADVVTVWQNLWHSSASTRTGHSGVSLADDVEPEPLLITGEPGDAGNSPVRNRPGVVP